MGLLTPVQFHKRLRQSALELFAQPGQDNRLVFRAGRNRLGYQGRGRSTLLYAIVSRCAILIMLLSTLIMEWSSSAASPGFIRLTSIGAPAVVSNTLIWRSSVMKVN